MSGIPNQQKPSDTSGWILMCIVVSTMLRIMLGFIGFPDEARWGIGLSVGVLLMYLAPHIRQRHRFRKWLWISFCAGAFMASVWHFLKMLFPNASSGPTAPFF